ncbi:MAG: hypothetical protein GPOALKHO_000430 [Sodalis sp.]|nr:MAG: hypothetical protein GPOALKHO_000430 [Sodalis sp.]
MNNWKTSAETILTPGVGCARHHSNSAQFVISSV